MTPTKSELTTNVSVNIHGICRIGYPTKYSMYSRKGRPGKRAKPATTAKKEDLPEEGGTVAAWTIS
jgi:hypothetical protein